MKNQNIMFTRSILNMSKARLFRSVLALAGVALIMQVSLPRAQAYDLSSLNGSYADSFSGFFPPGPPPPHPARICTYGPVYEAVLYTFDGAGGFTASSVFHVASGTSLNERVSQDRYRTYSV